MNAISIEVFQVSTATTTTTSFIHIYLQRSLAEFGASAGRPILPDASSSTTQPMTSAAPVPISAIPPHLQAQYRGVTPPNAISTPPTHTPTPPYGYSHPPAVAQPSNGSYGGYSGYPPGFSAGPAGASPTPAQPGITPGITEALATIPPEQKVCSYYLGLVVTH